MVPWVAIESLFVLVLFVGILTPLVAWAERRQSALVQDRSGPVSASVLGVRAGGLWQPLADGIRHLAKQPAGAGGRGSGLAPVLALVPPIVALAVIPYGGRYAFGGGELSLVVADVEWGLLLVFAASSLSAHALVLAGAWGDAASRLGAMRAVAQVIAYQLALGLSALGVLMVFGSLALTDVAAAQDATVRLAAPFARLGLSLPEWAHGFPFTLPAWGIFLQPLGFVLFVVCALASVRRAPFDLPTAGELAGGATSEYAGAREGLFRLAELVWLVLVASVLATLFLGGASVPWLPAEGVIGAIAPRLGPEVATLLCAGLHVACFLLKWAAMVWVLVLAGATLPRVRSDQLMRLCWKGVIPLALLNVFLTAGALLVLGGPGEVPRP